jgi:hypothetical protein
MKYHLDYLKNVAAWERNKVEAQHILQAKREAFILAKLREFEDEEKMKKEDG